MIQVCNLSFANSSITDTLGNYSLASSGNVAISGINYPTNTDPILYVTDSSYSCIEFGQTATYSNGAIIQAGVPTYGSKNWSVEFRARVTSAIPVNTGSYAIFFGCCAPYDDNGTIRTGGYWAISVDSYPAAMNELRFFYDYNNEDLTLKDNLDLTSWHLYKVTKTAEDILTLHIDGVLVATIDIEQQTGFKSRATLGSFALLGVVDGLPTASHIQTNQLVRLADVKVYADPISHAEKAISLDNLSRVFRNYNTWLSSQLSGTIGDGTLTIQQNGTNVATFTANQSTAATANITVPTAVSELTNDSGYLTASSNLDASKLTSGTVDIERLPQGALERLVKVANEAARYALTTADVQLGDTVQQLDTGIMYVVTDTDHLDSAAGYTEYTAGTAASVPWSGVTGKPTFAAVATSGAYSDLTGTPTIPTVNNATLTIQRNGTTVDTFTANASVDKTINISTADDTKIPLAGSNQISGSLIPATDNAYDLGGPGHAFKTVFLNNIRSLKTTETIVGFYNDGADLVLCPYGFNGGRFQLRCYNGTNRYALQGNSNGTLTWGSKNVAMQEDTVPRSGGAVLTGENLARATDNSLLKVCGGTAQNYGGTIVMYGKDTSVSSLVGTVILQPSSSSSFRNMIIYPDGTWTWDGTACQITSDQRLKQQITEIDDALLDAWEDVNLVQFKYNDAVDQKGDKARLHTGYVVQQIDSACKSHNVDISAYGLYCHEEYPEETEEVEVEQADGTKTKETRVIREASEHYSLRYTEVYAVECMYLRRCIKQLTTRIEQLTTRIEELEKGKEREAGK